MNGDKNAEAHIPAQSGKADSLLIFFHGYHAAGEHMKQHVGEKLAPHLPGTVMRFPDGPYEIPHDRGNYGWFHYDGMLDGRVDGNVAQHFARAALPPVLDYIEQAMQAENIPPERTVLAGFSQGATMAFYAALTARHAFAGVASISGGGLDQILDPELRKCNSAHRPQVLMMAGDWESSYYSGKEHSYTTLPLLKEEGYAVEHYLSPRNGHNICANSIEKVREFAQRLLLK